MGAEAYTWVTKYKKNLAEALRAAREETFAAGKFIGADEHPATVEEAVELGAEAGTGSILDITGVSKCPELCSVCPLTSEELIEFFGTERPTFVQIEKCAPFWESFDRGEARAVTLYKNGKPSQICFAGWTIDVPAAGSGGIPVNNEKENDTILNTTENGWPTWDLTKPLRVIYLIPGEYLREPASELVCKAQARFSDWGHFVLLNHGRDLSFAFPASKAIDSWSPEEETILSEMSDFFRSVRHEHTGLLDSRYINFPNGRNRIMVVTSMAESDSYNQLMLKVTHTDTIALNHPMTVTLKFRPRSMYLEEGEVPNFTNAIEKSEKIISEWFCEAKMVGFQNEFVFNDDFYIERVKNGCKFEITCSAPVQFPFWELYLRLRSGLTDNERFGTLSFAGSRVRKTRKVEIHGNP